MILWIIYSYNLASFKLDLCNKQIDMCMLDIIIWLALKLLI